VHPEHEGLHVGLTRRTGALEPELTIGCPVKLAIQPDQVKVNVQVEATAVALHEGHRAGLCISMSTTTRECAHVGTQCGGQDSMHRCA
jgi:hypothetical protein